jgi:hypothetical protein
MLVQLLWTIIFIRQSQQTRQPPKQTNNALIQTNLHQWTLASRYPRKPDRTDKEFIKTKERALNINIGQQKIIPIVPTNVQKSTPPGPSPSLLTSLYGVRDPNFYIYIHMVSASTSRRANPDTVATLPEDIRIHKWMRHQNLRTWGKDPCPFIWGVALSMMHYSLLLLI